MLLVEDNPATMDIIQTELEFLGYDTLVADNGKKAVEMAASHLPDLIIMDISLPKMWSEPHWLDSHWAEIRMPSGVVELIMLFPSCLQESTL